MAKPLSDVTYTVTEKPHTNGVVAMPIKKVTIELDEIGYPGWHCTLRLNPRSEVWDRFISDPSRDVAWSVFREFIIDWNFGDEDGRPFNVQTTKATDLPRDVTEYLVGKYIDAFNASVELPKAPESNSNDT